MKQMGVFRCLISRKIIESGARKIAGAQGAGAAIKDLEDPKAKVGRYLQKFEERLDTTGSNLNNPSVIMSREKKTN